MMINEQLEMAVVVWTMRAAKARLGEVLRQAREAGPQRITARGRDAAVVLSAEDYHRLAGSFVQDNGVERLRAAVRAGMDDDMDIEFERNPDTGREFEL